MQFAIYVSNIWSFTDLAWHLWSLCILICFELRLFWTQALSQSATGWLLRDIGFPCVTFPLLFLFSSTTGVHCNDSSLITIIKSAWQTALSLQILLLLGEGERGKEKKKREKQTLVRCWNWQLSIMGYCVEFCLEADISHKNSNDPCQTASRT